MNQFRESVKIHFSFLQQYGYSFSEEASDNVVSLTGEKNQLNVIFSSIGYELTCQFIDGNQDFFSLQDGLAYMNVKEFKGFYQIGSKDEIEKGVVYLANAVRFLYEIIDISDASNFQKIYQHRLNMHKALIEDYYVKNDIKMAEKYWTQKEYSKAKELFEKQIGHLSKTQLKKLEYISKI